MSTTATERPASAAPGGRRAQAFLRTAGLSLLVDAALPYLVYLVLSARGMPDVAALAWSALPPALHVGWQGVRTRRVEPVGAIVLTTIAVGLATSLISGDTRFAVAREALGSVVLTVLLLGSLVYRGRPLAYTVICSFGRMPRPDLPELMARQWDGNPGFRRVLVRATAVAALVTAAEAVLRVVVAYTVPVAVALPVLTAQSVVVWTGLSGLLVLTVRRSVRTGA